jgi:hypothetical protein
MTKIILIPNSTQNYDPALFTISVAKINTSNNAVESYRNFTLKSDYTLNIDLATNEQAGVKYNVGAKYNGVSQEFTKSSEGSESSSYTYQISSDELNKIIMLTITPSSDKSPQPVSVENDVDVNINSFNQKHPLEIKLTPTTGGATYDQSFWNVINSHKIDFKHYRNFIDDILSCDPKTGRPVSQAITSGKEFIEYPPEERRSDSKRLPFNRTEAYSLLKYATEKYVEHVYNLRNYIHYGNGEENTELEHYLGKDKITPYYDMIKSKIKEYFTDRGDETGFLKAHADTNFIELIWNYWYEEGMVNQTMVALARRFQNIKSGYRDPLSNFALDPLRPLNNILWGYIQDAQHRLTATRRNYEYTSEYDLCVMSTMKPGFNPADRRSKFLQSFHRLIYEATEYFVQADNTTIRPDGFKLLNALRDTHRILAEGAHNQFGDLPTVAKIETLMEQWILARPEVREFLGGRVMVPYEEPWMDRVDSMKALQGWDNTSISFYRDLAVYGEKIILGVRYGNWTNITNRDHATNWADAFRDGIQRYIHSYYTITGIDLAAQNVNVNSEDNYLLPGIAIKIKNNKERKLARRM